MLKAKLQLQELSLEKDDDQLFNELNKVGTENMDEIIHTSDETDDEYFDCFEYQVIISANSDKSKASSMQLQYVQDLSINPKFIVQDARTTLMLKNIPLQYTLQDLVLEIDTKFKGKYNYLHMPYDQNKNCNVGYAFINLITTNFVEQFYNMFDSKRWKLSPNKICTLRYAKNQINFKGK